MITYRKTGEHETDVILDGRGVGSIRPHWINENLTGYYYETRDGHQGETFDTVAEVKRSLEDD